MPQTSRIVLFCALLFSTFTIFSQTTIVSQSFDSGASGYSDDLGYTVSDANVQLNSYSESSPNSLRFGANSNVLFDNVDISAYINVMVTISFASLNANNGKDLFFGLSYDNGSNWEPEIKLIDGFNGGGGQDWNWGTPDSDGGAVSTNPYTISIPNVNTQLLIRIRGIGNDGQNRYLYIDNILVEGTANVPPTITSLGSANGCQGTSITINGTNLTGATVANVTIGGTPVTSITSNNGTTIVAVIGTGTTGTVSVTTSGGTATGGAFTVNTAPSITGTAPGARVGTGVVTLGATASSGTISWFANLTGGTALGTGTSYSPTVSTTTTYYVETNNGTCTSTPRTPVVATVNSYCTPTYSSGTSFGDLISNVTLGALNNSSIGSASSPYYTFYNAVTIPSLTQSSTASVSITLGSDSNQYAAVWIDFNQDGNFDAAEGVVSAVNAGSNGTTIINIPVPSSALTGNTRMRIRGGDDSTLLVTQACGASNSNYGETEDYIVNIISSAPPAITSLGSTSGCEGTSITINGTNLTGAIATNVTIGGTPVTSITSNNGTTIIAVIGTGTTGTVSVTTSGGTATSTATFTVNTAPTITSTSPASGTGTVALTLGATASSGTISWYANLTGGAVLGTGTSFTTPPISTTTAYYVETNNGTCTSSPRTPVVASFASFSEVIISVDWPSLSSENRVKIFHPSGALITTIDNGYLSNSNTSYSNTINLGCLEDLNNYYFTMYDGNNNGWDGADNITITVGGTTVINQNGDTANAAGVTVNFNVSGGGCALLTPLTIAPGGVTDKIQLWLKADKGITKNGADDVTIWATQAYGSNATINTPGQEPTFRDAVAYNVNFNPVVDFDSNYTLSPLDEFFTYNNTNGDFMEGSSGFYTQDMFMVLIPDTPINSTFGNMDLFCGDESFLKDEEDVTGIGFGAYSVRYDNEVFSYAVGTSLKTPPYIGYGAADNSTGTNYNNVGIINTRNSASAYSQELFYNAINVKTDENDLTAYSNVNNSRYWIGRSEAYEAATNVRIAEIITYSSRKDDTSERNRIETYLAIKYGITLGVNGTSQDYVDSDGTIIWDVNTAVPIEDVFNYNITGIGRDDASELNQKQSKSVNSIPVPVTADDITIGLIDIAATNNTNANTFGINKSFLVWGNNNGNLSASAATIVDMSLNTSGLSTVVQFQSFNRKWKLKESGTVGKVKVSLPLAMITPTLPTPGDYLMFISDSPTFSPTSEYKIMKVNGTNIETTFDFDGTKYITFGYSPDETFIRSIKFTGGTVAGGTNDYLDAGDVLDINTPTTAFTISAWIKRENTSASIVSKRDNGFTIGYNFGINGSGNLEMSWNGGSETITSSVPIPANKWHHVAVIFDGANAKLFIDGVEDVTQTTALASAIDNSESFLVAAADGTNTTSFFKGNIDEVRIWDIALTEDQLRFVMNQEIENNTNVDGSYFASLGFTPTKNDINVVPWANLMGYYPMSTYTFTNCKDASGNGNTAALKNLTTVDYQTAPLPYFSENDGAWDTPATWLNNTEQNLPNSLSIVDGARRIDWNIVEISDNNVLTSGSRDITVLGLNIKSTTADAVDTKLTIDGDNTTSAGNGLTVTHYLKLDGVLDLQGESQLIQTIDSDFDPTSNGYLERDQQGIENSFRYNYWSSPVNSTGTKYTIGGVLRDGTDPNNIKTIDFGFSYAYADVAITSPIKLSSFWMYVLRNSGLGYSAWSRIGNTGELLLGEGYTMKGSNTNATEQNYVFVGKPNNGTINLPVSANNEYLVGNPYPSAIDSWQFIDDNSPSGTSSIGNGGRLIFWEHYGGDTHNLKDYQGGYATLTKSGGVPAASVIPAISALGSSVKGAPGRYIPVGQAFFVDGSSTGGIIEFNNGQRIFEKEASGVSVFMKSSPSKSKIITASKTDLRPKFRIGFDAPKISHRQLLLTIDESTSDAVDWGYEAEIYDIISDDMYWMIDAKKYVIQATNKLTLDKEIPLGIETKEGGVIRIMIDDLENVDENTKIYIKDKISGETYDITNEAYEINLEAGEYQERFVLTFQPRLKTLQEVTLIEGVHVFMNNHISELQLNRIVDTEIVNVNLFNYLGQQVKTWNINTKERFISLPTQIATGVYIVRVNTTAGVITKKIIIE